MASISLHQRSALIVNIFVSFLTTKRNVLLQPVYAIRIFRKLVNRFDVNMTITRIRYILYLPHYALSTSVQLNLIGTNGTKLL